jgi:hypothetical protein
MIHQPVMNAIGWVLALAGSVAFAAATFAVIYFFVRPDSLTTSSETSYHDTYYVSVHTRLQFWPLVFCILLSALIAMIGYSRTDHFINRRLRSGLERVEKI